jgi:cytochrome c556
VIVKTIRSAAVMAILVLGAGAGVAEEATLPEVKARQALMQQARVNTAVLGDMASGKAAFDAAAAATAKAGLAAAAAQAPALFEPEVTEAASKAKPEIWTNWADFVAKSEDLVKATEALDVASLDALRAGMGAVGGACQACHTPYRNR